MTCEFCIHVRDYASRQSMKSHNLLKKQFEIQFINLSTTYQQLWALDFPPAVSVPMTVCLWKARGRWRTLAGSWNSIQSHFTEAQLVDSRSVKRAMTLPPCQRSIEWIEGEVVGAGHSSAAPGLANR